MKRARTIASEYPLRVPPRRLSSNASTSSIRKVKIIYAVLLGRNIYCNVRRFLQFQITFNVTPILIVFVGAIFRGATLFSVI